MLTFNNITF